jgi:aminoglycoside 6'-N-acetyltransferase I
MQTITPQNISLIDENDIHNCAELFFKVFNGPPWYDKWDSVEDVYCYLYDYFKSVGFVGVKAELNEKIIGCIFGNTKKWWSGDKYQLNEMFVELEFQNSGVGTVMLEALNITLEDCNIKSIILLTHKDFDAMKFYSAKGFHVSKNMITMVYDVKTE